MFLKQIGVVAALAAALSLASGVTPDRVRAQDPVDPGIRQVEAGHKGLVGLGLVGAELGFAVPAIAGLDQTWAFIVFPVLGATGGTLMGHYLIDQKGSQRAAVAMLALGIGLIVPTMVLTLAMTAYDPSDEADYLDGEDALDEGVDGEAEVELEAMRRPASPSHREVVARAGSGVLRLSQRGLLVGLPGVSVLPTVTAQEGALFGEPARSEVRIELLSGVF